MNDLQMWTDFKKLREEFIKVNMGVFLSKLLENPPEASQLLDIYHKTIYQAWLDSIFEKTTVLSEFRGQNHEKVIEEFRKLDKELVYLSGQKIIELCNSRRPKNILFKAQDSEFSILRREAAKKRKHLPIRHLFNRIPNLLLKLKPCLLMSPLSVSQFIQPDIKTEKQIPFDDYVQSEVLKFDLVIFDEASQIFTEDVVGAIYRGRQLIVAGDSKQLPPTNFFRTMDNDEDYNENEIEEETSADFNSVLDECSTILSPHLLKWHYRSKHESLIAFSNNQFYGDRLITFPSSRYKNETLGIKFVYVPDSVYDRGGKRNNIKEAEIVADKVFQHFTNYPNKSLGVVAFSQAQMIAIEDEIEQRRRLKPEFEGFFKEDRLEGFFVKNLENVQGDERDVIIFSIGYGCDQHGRMTMNFGPLNKPGGERRLNVAVTRAREKIILVSSIKASDIDIHTTKASGVLNLHYYLAYSEIGERALTITHPQGKGDIESPLEESVTEVIKNMGYNVINQVGCSGYRIDIGVIDPENTGQFLLGVECDGATYHSAATARDRDRLRQQILEGLGWKIHRIWSPDWVAKRETEVKKLKSAIEKARNDEINSSEKNIIILEGKVKSPEVITKRENNMTERISINHKDEDISLPGTLPYETCDISPNLWAGKDFHLPEYRLEQGNLIVKIVRKEGPIHIQLVAKRLVTAWGLSRTGNRIMKAVNEAVRYGEIRNLFIKKVDFLWPCSLTNIYVRTPVSGIPESFRDIEHIAPEEIQVAIKIIIQHALSIGKESLITETARIFGFNRTSDTIKEYILKEYKFLKKNGIIKENHYSVSL